MSAQLIDGKAVAKKVRAEAQARAATGHLELAGGALVPAPWVPTTAGRRLPRA